MLKKFSEGFVFGMGFSTSFMLVWYISAYLVFPRILGVQIQKTISKIESTVPHQSSSLPQSVGKPYKQFHELKLEEQIKQASVIAIVKYEKSTDGKTKAIIKEFLKKEPKTTIYYNVGDEVPGLSVNSDDEAIFGDGAIVFFTGSPATMKMAVTYTGDRIHGLGDIPIDLLREKCKEDSA